MALGFYFTPDSFTSATYDDALSRLEAAGAGAPAGRLYHAALETDGQIQVFDVWDSQAVVRRLRGDAVADHGGARSRSRQAAGFRGAQHHQGLSGSAKLRKTNRRTID